jgi:hypothetical protein
MEEGGGAGLASAFPPLGFFEKKKKSKLKQVLGRANRLCFHCNLYLIRKTETKTSVFSGSQAIFKPSERLHSWYY